MRTIDLRYFIVLSRVLHFTRAAEELGVTQPALSKGIRRLEETVRTRLVDSSSRSVKLTEAGEIFAARARIILGDIDAAIAEAAMREGLAHGNLRVGAGPIFAEEYLPDAIARLTRQSAELSFEVVVNVNTRLLELLGKGELDIAFCTTFQIPEMPQFHCEDLDVNHMAVLFRKEHPLASRERITPADLVDYEWVAQESSYLTRQWLMNKFRELNLPPPRIRVETRGHIFAQKLVERTDFLSFLPETGIVQDICHRIVPGLDWVRKVGAVYRADGMLKPSARMLINEMKRV